MASRSTALYSFGLLALSLLLLGLGHFIQFDDVDGYGSDEWVTPLGFLAALASITAAVVAVRDAAVSRWFGGALILIVVWLGWQKGVNEAFRFIWSGYEEELFLLQVLLAVAGCLMLTAALSPRPPSIAPHVRGLDRPAVRVAVYVVSVPVVVMTALFAGLAYFDRTECQGSGGDCSIGALWGLAWATVALVLCVVAMLVVELVLLARRRRARADA